MKRSHLIFLIIITLFFFLLLGMISWKDIAFDYNDQKSLIERIESEKVNLLKYTIASQFLGIISDLQALSYFHEIKRLAADNIDDHREDLINDLYFLSRKKEYDQIRFIDSAGWEIIRINYDEVAPYVVPSDQLQNKADRYYFQEIFNLESSQIYISPLDLNIENNKIEIPQKPVIRMGTAIFDDEGIKKGILVFNILGDKIIDLFIEVSSQYNTSSWFINSEGYWLISPEKPERQWAFMYDQGQNTTLENFDSEAWGKISSSDSGQFYTSQKVLYTFTTLHLHHYLSDNEEKDIDSCPAWKIVSYFPAEKMKEQIFGYIIMNIKRNLILMGILTIVLILLSVHTYKLFTRREQEKREFQNNQVLIKLTKAVDQSKNVMIITDLKGQFEYVNDSFVTVYGYAREDVLGKKPASILRADNLSKKERESVWPTLIMGKEWVGEFHNLKKNGERIWMLANLTPQKDKNGNITHILSSQMNIDHMKIAEFKLLDNEKNLTRNVNDLIKLVSLGTHDDRTLEELLIIAFETLNIQSIDILSEKDSRCRVIYSIHSDMTRKYKNLVWEEKIDINSQIVEEEFHTPICTVSDTETDSRATLMKKLYTQERAIRSLIATSFPDNDGNRYILCCCCYDEAREWTLFNRNFILVLGEMVSSYYQQQYRKDIEISLKESEEKHRLLFTTMSTGVIYQNPDLSIIIANPASRTLFEGIFKENDGIEYFDFGNNTFHEDGSLFSLGAFPAAKVFEECEKVENIIIGIYQSSEERIKWISINSIPLFKDDEEKPYCVYSTLTNLTNRKEMELAILEAKEKAEQSDRSKSAFLANMSHEIRTPMNAIIGFIDVVLDKEGIPIESLDHLRIARNSATNLLTIINDILDFSKIESGRMKMEYRKFKFENFLNGRMNQLKQIANTKNINLKLDLLYDKQKCIISDELRIGQILTNLVGNAIKFTNKGSVSVTISEKEAGLFLFSIKDTGIGLTNEQISTIFNPFSQADQTINRRFGGTGLGTSISKQLVELLGGEIWVESELGNGSTFSFTIPLTVPDCNKECISSGLACQRPEEEEDLGGEDSHEVLPHLKILLAEDIQENADLVLLRFSELGHEVVHGKNGREVVELFQKQPFDLILMDVHMPDMDGFEATKRIRELERIGGNRIPIIALTASLMDEEVKSCLIAGFDHVSGKPIDFEELFSTMGKFVSGSLRSNEKDEKGSLYNNHEISGIDIEEGLKRWQNEEAFISALKGFSGKYTNSDLKMNDLLERESWAELSDLIHTIKGLAGNLSLTNLSLKLIEMDLKINEKRSEDLIKDLNEYSQLLKVLINNIDTIQPTKNSDTFETAHIDKSREELKEDLISLFKKGENNDESLQKLAVLTNEVEKKQKIEEITVLADNLEFNKALEVLETLWIN